MSRTPTGGMVDRSVPLRFTFDGRDYLGLAGDTLASALLANGVRRLATSVALGRPRGVVSTGAEEPSAVVQIEAPFPDPMLSATMVEVYDGLVASSLAGQGRLARAADPARYDATNAHCEVLVVGGGTAGLTAALESALGGDRVILIDESSVLGGASPAVPDIERQVARVRAHPNVRVLTRTTAFAYNDDNFVLAVERRTAHLGAEAPPDVARERLWRIRARDVVLATGAHERLIAFANNDRPGVMLAGSAATYATRYGVRPGRRAVVFTNNNSAYAAAADLAAAGVDVVAVIDVRRQRPDIPFAQGIDVRPGHVVLRVDADHADGDHVDGDHHVRSVTVASRDGGDPVTLTADLLAVSGGWNPAVHLFSQCGGTTEWNDTIAAFVPATAHQRVQVVGSANGEGIDPVEPYWYVEAADPRLSFVDLQRDVTVADLRRATRTGMQSVEHVKRYTTAGTAHDQGKTSGVLTSAVIAQSLQQQVADVGTTSHRSPYTPVAFATLAGRAGGELLDPVRVTAIHEGHRQRGARFEDVGQWKRPWFYPRDGEDMDAAVARECRAARNDVAFMDASTLGKIEVQGPDAAAFLDLMYTNLISTLKVGWIRYGVMCHADGMIFDDGTVLRLADDRFLVTTTTGNAAAVLDWFEEWQQTEWPHLRVYFTSVTEQWATVALVGPQSRALLGELAPGLDVDADRFPFMTWRDATVAGLAARVCRISFSGELAYEINVAWSKGLALWQAIDAAGTPFGLTAYGTETMHVLRAEKGYPIIGQDSDGTITPQDLGMGWVVSKKKPDFVGKRSHSRAANAGPDRKQLVGLLPVDRGCLLREGTQLIDSAEIGPPPVPMLGFVTSSYSSVELDRTFALGLVRGGRERIGGRVHAVIGDRTVAVDVVDPVLVDPEGKRRDG